VRLNEFRQLERTLSLQVLEGGNLPGAPYVDMVDGQNLPTDR
jgi:hypothetical protein